MHPLWQNTGFPAHKGTRGHDIVKSAVNSVVSVIEFPADYVLESRTIPCDPTGNSTFFRQVLPFRVSQSGNGTSIFIPVPKEFALSFSNRCRDRLTDAHVQYFASGVQNYLNLAKLPSVKFIYCFTTQGLSTSGKTFVLNYKRLPSFVENVW